MSERMTPSDLVYLFVDGEATGAERTEMYAALATDNDLQSEFEDALRLKQTVDEEIAVTAPPYEATKALFMKAGFSMPVPIAGGEAIAPVISHVAESGIFTALKSLIAPFFVTTGIIATGVVSMPFFERIETGTSQASQVSTPVAQVFPTNTTTNTAIAETVPATTEQATNEQPVVTRTINREARNNASVSQTVATPFEPQDVVPPVTVVDEAKVMEIPAISSVRQEHIRQDYPSSVLIHESPVRIQQLADIRTETVDEPKDLWFEVHRITDLSMFPSRPTDGARDLAINNVALSAEYQITPTSRLGLAAGTETFPHYTVNADTSLTERWNIVWGGVRYTMTTSQLALGPIVPSLSFLVGGASTGPVGKAALAMTWQPDDRVSFTGGIEMTGLIYHYGTNWRVGGKLGATYSVAVRF